MSNNKQSSVRILPHKIQNIEWVFQFNDDEPIHLAEPSLFGYSNELSFTIGNTTDSIITFVAILNDKVYISLPILWVG